jgi:PAS domain S-box-containing protein
MPRQDRNKWYLSPWRALVVTVVVIFATDTSLMFLEYATPGGPDLPKEVWAFVDASLLVALTLPVLHFMFFRPVRAHISAQHAVEEALRDANEFRDLVTESATNAIYALDLEGRFTVVNRRTSEITGYSTEELLGTGFGTLFDPGPLAQVQERFAAVAVRGERVTEYEVDLRRKDGTSVIITFSIAPMHVDGAITGVVGTAEDITERKRAEAALRASEERLQLIVETSPDLITWLDAGGRLVFANSAGRVILGYDPDALRGQNMLLLIHPDDRARAMERLGALLGIDTKQGFI